MRIVRMVSKVMYFLTAVRHLRGAGGCKNKVRKNVNFLSGGRGYIKIKQKW
jgi:hypothetical protein